MWDGFVFEFARLRFGRVFSVVSSNIWWSSFLLAWCICGPPDCYHELAWLSVCLHGEFSGVCGLNCYWRYDLVFNVVLRRSLAWANSIPPTKLYSSCSLAFSCAVCAIVFVWRAFEQADKGYQFHSIFLGLEDIIHHAKPLTAHQLQIALYVSLCVANDYLLHWNGPKSNANLFPSAGLCSPKQKHLTFSEIRTR